MEDTDLIARVYPVLPDIDINSSALEAIQASPLYVAPQRRRPKQQVEQVQHERRDRQPTEPPDEGDISASHDMHCIELRFSDIPQSTHGIIFGRNPKSDVVIPSKSVSNYHFGLTFDDNRRLIVKDWGSLAGTEVSYDNEGKGTRRGFCWIVGGDPILQDTTSIVITIDETTMFRIVAVHHDIESQAYIENVDRFLQGMATTEHLFGDLRLLQRPDTELPTGTHTPGRGEIHLRKKIGQGSFGVVTHFWNVSNGTEYALKEPSEKALRQRMVDVSAWRKEARIMADLSHPHIVQLFGSDFTPHPKLRLEYVPGGALEDLENITAVEGVSILRQCLSALKYLHGSDPPVVHRDIKPGNILVQCRKSNYIHVKFGDFGLSKDSGDLSTICGSQKYLAPEICDKLEYVMAGGRERRGYSPAVDVWSLGVVVYEMACCLPRYRNQDIRTAWCEKIVNKLQKDLQIRPDDLKRFLSSHMVVLSPGLRSSAQDCYDRALVLPSAADPRPASHPSRAREDVAGEQQTVLWQDAGASETTSDDDVSDVGESEQTTIRDVNYVADEEGRGAASAGEGSSRSGDSPGSSVEPSRRIRSDAPSIRSHASTSGLSQKRPTTEFSSSSSGGRRSKRIDRHGKGSEATSRSSAGHAQGSVHPEHSENPEARSSIPRNQSRDTIEAANLLQALSRDPRTTTAVNARNRITGHVAGDPSGL